jgi:lysozyme family protein
MAAANLERILSLVFGHEGGFTDDPKDKGNWTGGKIGLGVIKGTKYGISAAAYPTTDIAGLTLAKAAALYRRDYWGKIRGDELPSGLDYCLFDFAVNSGVARAIMGLQRALNLADDGKMGPITLAAAIKADPQALIQRICADRLTFMRRLSSWPTYGKGWSRRVASVEREALKMASLAWPENLAPSDVNDTARAELASVARGLVSTPSTPSLWSRIKLWFGHA